MWTASVFWVAIAVGFLALAFVARGEIRAVESKRHPSGELSHVFIAGPVADSLKRLIAVELFGFLLAAAAAIFSALT
jgi:hypothetical protein